MSDQPSTPAVQVDEAETVNVTQSVEPAPESETDGEVTEITDGDSGSAEDS